MVNTMSNNLLLLVDKKMHTSPENLFDYTDDLQSYLDPDSIIECMMVCTKWREAIKSHPKIGYYVTKRSKNMKIMSNNLLVIPHAEGYDDGFVMNIDDYCTLSRILLTMGASTENIPRLVRTSIVKVGKVRNEDDEEEVGRVRRLALCSYFFTSTERVLELPPSIRQLKYLERLELSNGKWFKIPDEIGYLENLVTVTLTTSEIKSVPRSIGRLTNLKSLSFIGSNVCLLPDEIGGLINLTELNLSCSAIASIPPSIGQLQNLKKLHLHHTKNLTSLPNEIWDLTGLSELNLSCSAVKTLPASIRQLRKLKTLHISDMPNLEYLPDEICSLVKLENLYLDSSKIASLPTSIGNLKRLKKLSLINSDIKSIPASIGKLQKLECLNLMNTTPLLQLPEEIGDLSRLGFLYLDRTKLPLSTKNRLAYSLGCMKARCRTHWGITDDHPIQQTSSLWPIMLHSATKAFNLGYYTSDDWRHGSVFTKALHLDDEDRWRHGSVFGHCEGFKISTADAIFKLIEGGMESFTRVLMDRHAPVEKLLQAAKDTQAQAAQLPVAAPSDPPRLGDALEQKHLRSTMRQSQMDEQQHQIGNNLIGSIGED